MLSLFFFALALGAIMNRVRGGLLGDIKNYSKPIQVARQIGGTGISLIAFFALMVFDQSSITDRTPEGVAIYSFDWQVVFLAVLAMWVGEMPGWGRYIGALGNWETKELKEFAPIDILITSLKRNKRLWGFAGLTLRGLVWTLPLSLVLWSFWPLLAGITMGIVYGACIEIMRVIKNDPGKGWPIGEYVFGAILWASCVI